MASKNYVVMVGSSPYYSTLGVYASGHRQWNPVGDGFEIDAEVNGIATLEEAIRECDAAGRRLAADNRPYVVALPVQINPNEPPVPGRLPGAFFDPELSRVYTAV